MTADVATNDQLATVYRTFDAFNRYDTAAFVDCYTEDLVFEDTALKLTFTGREAMAKFMDVWVAACPDTRIDVGEVIVAADRAAVPWTGMGTLEGTFDHLPPTAVRGSRIEQRGLSIMEFAEDGRIKRQTDYYDMLTVLQQIGVIPAQS